MPIILDGKSLSTKLNANLKTKIAEATEKYGRPPGLATVLVGEDKASQTYVNMKIKTSEELGIKSFHPVLPKDCTIELVYQEVQKLNSNPEVDGILVQMPLPSHLRQYESAVMELIKPDKDVDGFHPQSIGLNVLGDETYSPCTPKGMIRLLEEYNLPIAGQETVIVNRTNVIGKPLMMMFLKRNATITVCHTKTKDLDFHLKRADIIAIGVGKVNFLTADRIKEGCIILDAGINKNAEGKLCGDVDYKSVFEKCKAITPVPGGIGPMTIAMLMENTYLAFLKHVTHN